MYVWCFYIEYKNRQVKLDIIVLFFKFSTSTADCFATAANHSAFYRHVIWSAFFLAQNSIKIVGFGIQKIEFESVIVSKSIMASDNEFLVSFWRVLSQKIMSKSNFILVIFNGWRHGNSITWIRKVHQIFLTNLYSVLCIHCTLLKLNFVMD